MAMYHEYLASKEQLRDAFEKAAAENKYMIVIGETIEGGLSLGIERSQLIRTAADAAEAISLLKNHFDRFGSLGAMNVDYVFDPAQTFEQGLQTSPGDSALGDVLREFKDYCRAKVAKKADMERPLWKKVLGLN